MYCIFNSAGLIIIHEIPCIKGFFTIGVEVGVEESIVNEPLVLKTQIFSNCRLKTPTQKVRLDLNS
jgi:hypothetical protein